MPEFLAALEEVKALFANKRRLLPPLPEKDVAAINQLLAEHEPEILKVDFFISDLLFSMIHEAVAEKRLPMKQLA